MPGDLEPSDSYDRYTFSSPSFTHHPIDQIPSSDSQENFNGTPQAPNPSIIFEPVVFNIEYRFQRLLESYHQWQRTTLSSSHSNVSRRPATAPDPVMPDVVSSRSSPVANGKHTDRDEGKENRALEEEKKEKRNYNANFDCHICLDEVKEPVVTSCGHLFCWPCLYQWLHLHSPAKECPVCKGMVINSKIIPIYSTRSSVTIVEKKSTEYGESGLKIPPRPGVNSETFRTSQTFRTLQGGQIHGSVNEALTSMPLRPQGQELNPQTVAQNGDMVYARNSSITVSQIMQDQPGPVRQYTLDHIDRLRARIADLESTIRELSSRNPLDWASTSSTIATIQGSVGVTDASVEPNNGGSHLSFRSTRRRRGNSDSSDVDAGARTLRRRRGVN